jgi:hypothetical protein
MTELGAERQRDRRRRGLRGQGLLAALVSTVLSLPGGPAHAEPHFSARTGLRCSRCHVSPTGGGKRTAYGVLFEQTELTMSGAGPRSFIAPASTSPGGGSRLLPGLATGELTDWMAVGADLRLVNQTTFGAEPGNSFEATEGTLYLEVRPWPGRVVLYLDEELGAGGARNREAWGMVRGPWATYLRGGRFLPPFGLRILDDAAYTRRVTGVNFTNPDLGLEAGIDWGPLFFAVALSNGSFAPGGDTDNFKALWALAELNFSLLRVGLSGNYNPGDAGCRAMGGVFAALRLARLVVQGELDLIGERPGDQTRWGAGLASYVELDLAITKGVTLRASWDFTDADLALRQDRRQRFRFGLDLFPLRMVEVKLGYVLRQSETIDPIDAADLLEAVLHVYL